MLQATMLPSPAFNGLALDRQSVALGPDWATDLDNVVIDASGRLAARKGWALQNTGIAGSPAIRQMHEYLQTNGTSFIISSTATKIYSGTTGALTDITPATPPTAGNWKFQNFNGKVLGWQASHTPISWNGAGIFTNITASSGTLPTGDTALAAFGRVWGIDSDKQTIRYSALLDETKWGTADGGGVLDMRSVWTRGMDEVVAIVAYGANLVVFGKRHIIVWADGSGSELGLEPVNLAVQTVIENVGAIARDTVVLLGELDVVFWSPQGIRTLARTIQEFAAPDHDMSPSNRQALAQATNTGSVANIRGVYSPTDALVLFSHPDASTTYCFDVRGKTPDAGLRMTTWTIAPTALCNTVANALYFGFDGKIGLYSTYRDNATKYTYTYVSGWILLPPDEREKLLKRLKGTVYSTGSRVFSLSTWVDFGSTPLSENVSVSTTSAEYGIAQYNIDEYSGGTSAAEVTAWLTRECQYVKVGVTCDIDGLPFAVHALTVYYKPTNLA